MSYWMEEHLEKLNGPSPSKVKELEDRVKLLEAAIKVRNDEIKRLQDVIRIDEFLDKIKPNDINPPPYVPAPNPYPWVQTPYPYYPSYKYPPYFTWSLTSNGTTTSNSNNVAINSTVPHGAYIK